MFNWKEIEELRLKMINSDLEIGVDFDELLWDLHYATTPFLIENYGKSPTKEEISYWEYLTDNFPKIKEAWGDFEIYKKGRPIEGSINFINVLTYIFGKNRVKIVTATFPQIISEKEALIFEIFGISNVIHTRNKYEHTANCILVDDGLHNIIEHVANNDIPGIIFDLNYGWNQQKLEDTSDKIFRAKSYQDVISILNKLY